MESNSGAKDRLQTSDTEGKQEVYLSKLKLGDEAFFGRYSRCSFSFAFRLLQLIDRGFFFEVRTVLGEDVGLNLLINNAGILIAEGSRLKNADRSVYLQHFDTNVVSVVKVIEVSFPFFNLKYLGFKSIV